VTVCREYSGSRLAPKHSEVGASAQHNTDLVFEHVSRSIVHQLTLDKHQIGLTWPNASLLPSDYTGAIMGATDADNAGIPIGNGHDAVPTDTNNNGNGHYRNAPLRLNGDTIEASPCTSADSPQTPSGNGAATNSDSHVAFAPIAICGMACRLPGGISSPEGLWHFLLEGGDGRSKVPSTRFNISAYHNDSKKPGTANTEYGYFLDEKVDLAALDTTFFSIPRNEVARLDPQQRLLLEVAREAMDDACETGWQGGDVGVYVGTFSLDWYDTFNREPLKYGIYQATTTHDFMISERLSHEMDLRGPR